ncbi:uncharacterized protein L969DRAFT_89176 [Mixia osmundae IAM 14324]|uniref:REM-1 domain-containing protein n=1 Tax=Mixia osmundae (strain CBS 9802 / IAM 14324 / JCM 22182 / KY 12970) TaxID=764103 RepID=G7DSK3_MIXOS|nr:uncharacterized protein L969DRAFT_89176 [Mixia osmundae IAM 14324]KEI37940.1 hypothetical protein L969DRAFT_89176 [Mixia osmundae IAM 14324]GAA93563.1 hypothetical protein E5Q_00207 [Mixia osmundae IAM 14324]
MSTPPSPRTQVDELPPPVTTDLPSRARTRPSTEGSPAQSSKLREVVLEASELQEWQELYEELQTLIRVKDGALNLLASSGLGQTSPTSPSEQTALRDQVQAELERAQARIDTLQVELGKKADSLQRASAASSPRNETKASRRRAATVAAQTDNKAKSRAASGSEYSPEPKSASRSSYMFHWPVNRPRSRTTAGAIDYLSASKTKGYFPPSGYSSSSSATPALRIRQPTQPSEPGSMSPSNGVMNAKPWMSDQLYSSDEEEGDLFASGRASGEAHHQVSFEGFSGRATPADRLHDLLTRLSTLAKATRPDENAMISCMSSISQLIRRFPKAKYQLDLVDIQQSIMPCLDDSQSKSLRTMTWRLLRLLVTDFARLTALLHSQSAIHIYIIKALSKDAKSHAERQQVLLFVRACIQPTQDDVDHPFTSVGVIRAVVAVAEHTEDKLRWIALETLAELALIDIDLLARSGGLKRLLQSVNEGPSALSPMLAGVFAHLLDLPASRSYFRPGIDLQSSLGVGTEAVARSTQNDDRLLPLAQLTISLLRSWSGLFFSCLQNKQAIRSLVGNLATASLAGRETALDTLFQVFDIATPSWYVSYLEGRRLSLYRQHRLTAAPLARSRRQADAAKHSNRPGVSRLNDHFRALFLLIWTEAGGIEALVSLTTTETTAILKRKSALLLAELMQLSKRVLPASHAAKLQALPHLFADRAGRHGVVAKLAASNILLSVDSLTRSRRRSDRARQQTSQDMERTDSSDDPLKRGQKAVESARVQMGMQVDDVAFRNLLIESQVLSSKDHTKWNYDTLLQLAEGPLRNEKRLEEAIRGSKFMHRLLAFYHPHARRYSDLKNTPDHAKWTNLATVLLTTLLATREGSQYLREDGLLREISDCLSELDPLATPAGPASVFSRQQLEETVSTGYFNIIGVYSRHREGVKLMSEAHLFTLFYHLSDLRSREDLSQQIVKNLSYDLEGHTRIILNKTLTSSYKQMRLFATRHLGELIKDSHAPTEWIIRCLLLQLYDSSNEVRELVVDILYPACDSPEILETIVELEPSLDHLGEVGIPLLTRFMSTTIGTRYLFDIGYIERELQDWFHYRNFYYAVKVELALASLFGQAERSPEEMGEWDDALPVHFYGELAKTEDGCAMLEASGHFADFAQYIRDCGLEGSDLAALSKLKSVLWAVGNIAASEVGFQLVEDELLIPDLIEVAERSPCLTVRGTCFFVLGLVSSTAAGAATLAEYGWETTRSPLGQPLGICLPRKLDSLLTVEAWQLRIAGQGPPSCAQPIDKDERSVVSSISNLSNYLMTNTASKQLAGLKSRRSAALRSPEIYWRALSMLEHYHYRLPIRRYILELFDLPLCSATTNAISEAGRALMDKATIASPEHTDDAALEQKQSTVQNPRIQRVATGLRMPALDSDSDSDFEGHDGMEKSSKSAMPAQALDPMLVIRGFLL